MPQPQIAERARLRYRPDIDGLRAIAVVPVVLYHYRVPGFSGGFVGVDVFFVISGYLITALIHGEMREGEFSILGFYERRARRILPALFAVIAASFVAAAFLFFPRDLMRFAESAAATALFGSNFDFWLQSGYFDVDSELKPLLHTWSLAVEEQFYVVFPALLLALNSRKRSTLLAFVAALAVVSFSLSVWGVRHYDDAAFYLAPYRTWELMVGAILALAVIRIPDRPLVRDALALSGLALIGWAIFTFDPATPFPGENALFPCVGAALIVLAGEDGGGFLTRALSLSPIVFIGLISYSLYLWHWPLFVFATYAKGSAIGVEESAILIAASFGLAVLSWRFVERPFRAGRRLFTRPRLFRLAGAAIATTLVLAGALYKSDGLPGRFPPDVQAILAESFDAEPRRHECFNRTPEEVERGDFCVIGDPSAARPSFLLWGDSHADALLPAVETAAVRAHRQGIFIGHGLCPPLFQLRITHEPSEQCQRLNEDALELIKQKAIPLVILAARWGLYVHGTGFRADMVEPRRLIDLAAVPGEDESQPAVFVRVLTRTVDTLLRSGRKVVLVDPVPEVGIAVPEALARAALGRSHEDIRPSAAVYYAWEGDVRAAFDALHDARGVTVVDPAQLLCREGRCSVEADGRPLYVDHNHLSVFGAERLSPLFQQVL